MKNLQKEKIAHSKLCFPLNCKAVKYCYKWNDIPYRYEYKVDDLKGTHNCVYKDAYYEYLESDQWLNIRRIALMKSDFKCEKCGNKENLNVHHLNYNSVFDEKIRDIIVLCKGCHKNQHNK